MHSFYPGGFCGVKGILAYYAAAYAIFHQKVGAVLGKHDIDAFFQKVLFYGKVYLLGLFGAQMAYGAVDQPQAGLYGPFADILDLVFVSQTLHFGVGAKAEIYFIGVIYKLRHGVVSYKLRQVAADFRA